MENEDAILIKCAMCKKRFVIPVKEDVEANPLICCPFCENTIDLTEFNSIDVKILFKKTI